MEISFAGAFEYADVMKNWPPLAESPARIRYNHCDGDIGVKSSINQGSVTTQENAEK